MHACVRACVCMRACVCVSVRTRGRYINQPNTSVDCVFVSICSRHRYMARVLCLSGSKHRYGPCFVSIRIKHRCGPCFVSIRRKHRYGPCFVSIRIKHRCGPCFVSIRMKHRYGPCFVSIKVKHRYGPCFVSIRIKHRCGPCFVSIRIKHRCGPCFQLFLRCYFLRSALFLFTEGSTGMHQQSALLISFGCCCCHSKHSFPLKGSSLVDRFPFHDHKQAKVTDMKTEEDVCDECVQFVCISAQKASTINNKEGSST